MTGGFDIEVSEKPPDNFDVLFPPIRHHQLKTAVLNSTANTKFDLRMEPQPEDPYLFYRGGDKEFRAAIRFNDDPSKLLNET